MKLKQKARPAMCPSLSTLDFSYLGAKRPRRPGGPGGQKSECKEWGMCSRSTRYQAIHMQNVVKVNYSPKEMLVFSILNTNLKTLAFALAYWIFCSFFGRIEKKSLFEIDWILTLCLILFKLESIPAKMQTENKLVFLCSSRCIFWVDEPYFFSQKGLFC